ncbi:small acid-soluble spore protein Tlp [Marasmitruncus massiliensis]|uniref:small acid-soluble spore protein Tlp n=1 Tax=Marasmitruncus massiliensis TaxID=1944642 RepID=UPI000C7A0F8A|nr:small acid-soluble spore protein Tlp [Marasmitruncus massiliensis]
MKPNPDDRSDNVDRIQRNIDMTIENMHRAEEMIATTPDQKMKQVLKEKNQRREQALEGMRHEIRDEAQARKNQTM